MELCVQKAHRVMCEQGLRTFGVASVSPLLILLGLKEEILRCRATAQTFCVLLACASSWHSLLIPGSGGWRAVGGGSCGNAGLLVTAAGLDLSGEGASRGLDPSWFREVPGQQAQHLVWGALPRDSWPEAQGLRPRRLPEREQLLLHLHPGVLNHRDPAGWASPALSDGGDSSQHCCSGTCRWLPAVLARVKGMWRPKAKGWCNGTLPTSVLADWETCSKVRED